MPPVDNVDCINAPKMESIQLKKMREVCSFYKELSNGLNQELVSSEVGIVLQMHSVEHQRIFPVVVHVVYCNHIVGSQRVNDPAAAKETAEF